MFNALQILARICLPVLGLAACAMGPREGPPAPVVTVSPRLDSAPPAMPVTTEVAAAAPMVAAPTKAPPKPAAPKKKATVVYAYREPGSEPEPEPEADSPAAAAGVPARPAPRVAAPAPVPAVAQASREAGAASVIKVQAPIRPSVKPPTVAAATGKPVPDSAFKSPTPATTPQQTVVVSLPSAPSAKPFAAGAQTKVAVAASLKTAPAPRLVPATPVKPAVAVAATASPAPRPVSAAPPPVRPATPVADAPPPIVRALAAPAEPATGLAPAADSLARQAEQQRSTGDYAGAAATLERSLRIAPREAYLWNRLARVRMEQGLSAQAGQLAARSNDFAGSQTAVKKDNWRIIAEAKRRTGDAVGAGEAQQRAGGD